MPKLTDIRQTKSIALPSYPDSKVVIYDSMIMKTSLEVSDEDRKNPVRLLKYMIKEWNFTGEDDKLLPINEKSISLLKADDATFLIEEIAKFAGLTKKK